MRIALTITELDPGGAEQCLAHLAIFLQSKGHEVAVFALGRTADNHLGESPDRNRLIRQLDRASIPWICGQARSWRSLPASVRWLRSELISFRPDVIQSMLFHANVVTAMANRRLGIPFFGGERVRQVPTWRRWSTRFAASRMEKLVCVSQSIAQDYRGWFGIPEGKLSVIPNGIPESDIQSPEPEAVRRDLGAIQMMRQQLSMAWPAPIPPEWLDPHVPVLLFAGRLSHQKGIESLVLHSEELLSRLPHCLLVILGDGPLKNSVQHRIAGSQVRSQIHCLGWQPNVGQWLLASDILLLPSLYEGMPNVVLEAMSAGRPVVCFDVEGIQELLGSEAHPQVVPRAHWDDFSGAVRAIIHDGELAKQLGRQNLQRVREQFLLTRQLERYEQFYLEAAGNPQVSTRP